VVRGTGRAFLAARRHAGALIRARPGGGLRRCRRETFAVGPFPAGKKRLESATQHVRAIEGSIVPSTFDKVADIIADTSEIDRDTITPESHTIDDLGIDSLDFLDIVFAIDKEFGIKVPLEKWTQEVNDGKVSTEEYFVMKNLCAKIDALVAAKARTA
jgi:acyl carrier protein